MRTRDGRPARSRVIRWSASLLGVAGLTASAVFTGAALHGSAAAADPLADAKAQAARLQAQVAALQTAAEQASEKYDAAEAALGDVVVKQRLAGVQAQVAQATLDRQQTVIDSRARALYMSGGKLAIYAGVLDGHDPSHLLAGFHAVQAMSDADTRALADVGQASTAAASAQSVVAGLVQQQGDLLAQAQAAADQVQAALDAQQQALDAADSQVREIEAQMQAELDAENAARAAATRAATLGSGLSAGDPTQVGLAAIAAARTQLGKPYLYGGSGPDSWDCSGLTQWAYRQAGVDLPRTAAEQYEAVPTKVALDQLRPGDLLFWAIDTTDPATIHHVAIYLGGGLMLAAPHTGTVVQIQPVYLDGYFGAVRAG